MTRFLLDTNIVSRVIREPHGLVANRIREVGAGAVAMSIVVAGELRFGAEKRRSSRLTALVEGAITRFAVLPLAAPADRYYGDIRTRLERAGQPIGNADLWIAAHALALDCTLFTDNVGEFARVEGLKVENWLR